MTHEEFVTELLKLLASADVLNAESTTANKPNDSQQVTDCNLKVKEEVPKDVVQGNAFSADELDDDFRHIAYGEEFYLYAKIHGGHVWHKASDKLIHLNASPALGNYLVLHTDNYYTERLSSAMYNMAQKSHVDLADIDIKFHIHKKDTHFEKSMEI
jgi:hypothetical protein